MRDFIAEHHGRVDGLINNAGVTSRVRLPDVELEEWNRVLAVNLTGPMLGIKTLLPLMHEGSSIVNVGSIAGLTGHYTAAYTASKWGLRGLTRTAATELGSRGIRVNAVHPGYIHTPMTANAPETFLQANLERHAALAWRPARGGRGADGLPDVGRVALHQRSRDPDRRRAGRGRRLQVHVRGGEEGRHVSGRLQGKVALISGTARGQGAEAKARFEAEGATVVGGDILARTALRTST